MANVMTTKEHARLKELKGIVSRGLNTFIEVGLALAEIRDGMLFRETHHTFKEFVEAEFGLAKRHAERIMVAAKIAVDLIPDKSRTRPIGSLSGQAESVIPESERQVRPLVELPEEERGDAWEGAVASANGKQPTAEQVQAEVDKRSGTADTIDEKGSVVDSEGETVPELALPAFDAAKEIVGICREMDALIRRVEVIAKGPGGRLIHFDSFKQQVKDAKGNIYANRPTHVCPYCHGKGGACKCCKGDGWTARHIWSQAPGNHKPSKE